MKGKMKQTEADLAVTKAAFENSGNRLAGFVGSIEEHGERIKNAKAMIKSQYEAATSEGFDKNALKRVIKERARTDEEREASRKAEEDLQAIAETYFAALQEVGE